MNNNIFKSNQHGKYINTKLILEEDFNVTPEEAMALITEIENSDAKAKDKVDMLLKIDCTIYCNYGIESTKKERAYAKAVSAKIYKTIYKLDKDTGELLITTKD